MDFLALSYYYSTTVSASKNTMNPTDNIKNPYLKANPWGGQLILKDYTILYLNIMIDTKSQ